MSSKTSAAWQPEFFVDRSLGKLTARRLRDQGWALHLIADHYPDDAQRVPDEEWIAEGCRRGWSLLTKDARIRYRASELAALSDTCLLFCLANQQLTIDQMVAAFTLAQPAMHRAIAVGRAGFWHVAADGRTTRKWP